MVAISFYKPDEVNATLNFPTEWNELTAPELEQFSHHQLWNHASTGEMKVLLLQDLLTIRAKRQGVKLPGDFFSRLDPDDVATGGLDLLSFVFEKNERTKQPYPVLLVGKQAMIGPADDFNALSCGEFEDAEIFWHQFREEPGPEHLARLAAILYRPAGKKYMQFDAKNNEYINYDVEKTAPQFLKLPPPVLFSIFTWYSGCRSRLPLLFPTAFESDGSGSDEPDAIAFTKCIHGAAGPKNGTRNQVRITHLKELFMELEIEAQKAKELRKMYANMKR